MRRLGGWTLFWVVVIAGLVLVELAEITRLFTIPLSLAFLSPFTILLSLVLTTILALVGAVFVGFYLSSQIYHPRGFTPFEEEMLRMREDVLKLREATEALEARIARAPPAEEPISPGELGAGGRRP